MQSTRVQWSSFLPQALPGIRNEAHTASCRPNTRQCLCPQNSQEIPWQYSLVVTITAEEEYISRIDLRLAKISQHPKWALLKSLKDRPHHSAIGTASQVVEGEPVTKVDQRPSDVTPNNQIKAATPQISLSRPNYNSFWGAGNHHPPDPPPHQSYPLPQRHLTSQQCLTLHQHIRI